MYLTDAEIRERLDDLNVTADDPDFPFEPDTQIQPCSIDLRLSNVFWRPTWKTRFVQNVLRRRKALDLTRAHINVLAPRRGWRRVTLSHGQSQVLRPGQMMSGRIYERLTIPDDCAGKIEGRSSYARLGLAVHCTGDFINPGWSGYMPLQLVNLGPFPIRILPHVPLCQLMLIPLGARPSRVYGDETLSSKYVNDDGGPSYWWRDSQIKELHRKLGEADVSLKVQNEIIEFVRFTEPDVLERLERLIHGKKTGEVSDADALLEEFAKREDRRRVLDRLAALPLPLFVAGSIGAATQTPVTAVHWVLWALTAVSVPAGFYAFFLKPQEYFGAKEYNAAQTHGGRQSA
jgi:deoxycytidine triphosphate deaminase